MVTLGLGRGDPGAGVCLLMSGAEAQDILGLVPTHWWVRLSPGSSADPLVGVAVSWHVWLQGCGFPELVLACWLGEVSELRWSWGWCLSTGQ